MWCTLWLPCGVLTPLSSSLLHTQTGFVYHPECREHRTMEGHFEAPERLDAIMEVG